MAEDVKYGYYSDVARRDVDWLWYLYLPIIPRPLKWISGQNNFYKRVIALQFLAQSQKIIPSYTLSVMAPTALPISLFVLTPKTDIPSGDTGNPP